MQTTKFFFIFLISSGFAQASTPNTPANTPKPKAQVNPNAYVTFTITSDADGSTTKTLIVPASDPRLTFKATTNSKDPNTLNCFRGAHNIGQRNSQLITGFMNSQELIAPLLGNSAAANRTFRIYLGQRVEEVDANAIAEKK